MPTTLKSLHRLREHARHASQAQVHEARVERDRQLARVEGVQHAMRQAREQLDPADVLSLSTWHAYRLRQELTERRESARLAQRERDLNGAEVRHAGRVRDELAIQSVIDAHAAAALADLNRQEARTMDEIGGRLRWSA